MDKEHKAYRFQLTKELSVLYKRGRAFMDSMILKHELGSGHYTLIFYLSHNNGSSQDDISRNMEIDKTTVARGLARLEEQGYIERKVDEKDRRVNRVFLTQKASELIPMLMQYSNQWQEILVSDFSESERELLEQFITRMNTNAQSYRNQMCKKGGQHDK